MKSAVALGLILVLAGCQQGNIYPHPSTTPAVLTIEYHTEDGKPNYATVERKGQKVTEWHTTSANFNNDGRAFEVSAHKTYPGEFSCEIWFIDSASPGYAYSLDQHLTNDNEVTCFADYPHAVDVAKANSRPILLSQCNCSATYNTIFIRIKWTTL